MAIYLPRRRILSVLKVVLIITVFLFIWYYWHFKSKPEEIHLRFPPKKIAPYICPLSDNSVNTFGPSSLENVWKKPPLTDQKVLVFVETTYSKLGRQIVNVLNAVKVPYKVESLTKNLPLLANAKRGRFSSIIFENYYKYLNLSPWNRQLLDKYCRDYEVGIIGFLISHPSDYIRLKIKDSPLTLLQKQTAKNLRFYSRSQVNYIAKPGPILHTPKPLSNDWVLFEILDGYESIISANDDDGKERAAVILDKGTSDNIQRILFGHGLSYWMNQIAFIDSIRYMSKGKVDVGLDRYIQIDVDDVFVGASGGRMVRADADALLQSQERLRKSIEHFTYCLGFSGHYFRSGDSLEDSGDERLIELASNFVWFPHMWRHNHAHECNLTYLEAVMAQNKLFAQAMKLPAFSHYSVSPQHAGVYPVHEALYTAWHKIWDIWVTSTEEYPHLRPAATRRGFVHQNISVLPRQTCGLYTHTHFFHAYPGGFSKLLANIEGGDLFFTLLVNPFSVFMTHQQNFANDRLGMFTFEREVDFLKCWTNLRLKWVEPVTLAKHYFERFPNERMPVWGNPCIDARHMRILPAEYNCSRMLLPEVLIVGPQKSGSTALATYLGLHPSFSTNKNIPLTFEELQFFGGSNYQKGILWYMDQFSSQTDIEKRRIFEKSATYFDNAEAPRAAAALLPKADIVIILHDPSMRAYSWYQHMRAHNDTAALAYSFNEILDANQSSSISVRHLKQRCISPGRYVHHIERWLDFFPFSQLHFVDGKVLRENPIEALKQLIESLHMEPFPYENWLKYNSKKGFFCVGKGDGSGGDKCLGPSKGRKYAPMEAELKRYVDNLFLEDNIALARLLSRNDVPIPIWLKDLLSQKDYAS